MSDTAIATVPQQEDVHKLIARVGDKNLTFGQRLDTVGKVMEATARKMMAALPKHITPDRMVRVTLNAIRKNPKLLNCNAASLFGAITEACTYGWEIGGVMGHCYLVPFKDEATLIPGYKGLIDLCRRSGQISTVSLEVVHEGDKFDYAIGDDPHITHKPDDRNAKRESQPITYAYVVVKLRDGGIQRSVWSRERIEAHKEQYSKGWRWAESGDKSKGGGMKDSPWHTAWPTMAKKTVIRDMIQRGLVPVSAEYRDVVQRGVDYDDDGGLDLDGVDLLPPAGGDEDLPAIEGEVTDAGERPQTGDEPSSDLSREADTAFLDADSVSDVEAIRVSLARKATTEADKTMLLGKAAERTESIRVARAKKKE